MKALVVFSLDAPQGAPDAFSTLENVGNVDCAPWGLELQVGISFPHFHIFILRWGHSSGINDFEDVYVDFVHKNGGILWLYFYNITIWHVSPKMRASLHNNKCTGAKELGFRSRGTQSDRC